MRISIHDLSDSDDEPIVVLSAPVTAHDDADDGDGDGDGDEPSSPTAARKMRAEQARTARALAGRMSAKLSLGVGDALDDGQDDELLASLDNTFAHRTRPSLSLAAPPSRSLRQASIESMASTYGPSRRSLSLEPSRPMKRDYTPYWTSPDPPPSRARSRVSPGADDGELISGSSSASSDQSGSEVSSTDEEDIDDADDSEEEQWPVNPAAHRSSRRRRTSRSARRRREDDEVLRRIRLSAVPDQTGSQAAKDRVWVIATSRYHAQAQAFTKHRQGDPSATSISSAFNARKSAGRQRTPFGLSVVSEEAAKSPSAAINEVQDLLRQLHMRRDEDERRTQADFEARSKQLWDSVEAIIREAEHKNEAEAAEKTAVLIAKRREQEANERAAREAREAEQRRIAEEQERKRIAAEEAKRKEEEERQRVEAEAKAQAEEEKRREKEAAHADAAKTLGDTAGPALWLQSKADYVRWYGMIQDIKANVLPIVASNQGWRQQCFMAKRQITPKIGQLTNSRSEIVRITLSIADVLNQAQGANDMIYSWILNHLSKCLIRQAEQEVAAKVNTAYPLARVVVWLIFGGHPKLADVLMARLVKKCCYVVGYWPSKGERQSDAEYRKQLGRPSAEETTHAFNSRMSGIFALYCAILQTEPTQPPTPGSGTTAAQQQQPLNLEVMPAHFRPDRLWTWQARAMTKPMSDHPLTPTLLATCFEVAGARALAYYGAQMAKLWRLLLNEGIRAGRAGFVSKYVGPGKEPGAEDGGAKAAAARLQLLLEEWEKTGVVKAMAGADRMDN